MNEFDNVTNRVKELTKNHKVSKVCSTCFKQRCNCENKTLIQIDQKMASIIKMLNKKGYKTVYCCESHYKYSLSLYIFFSNDYFSDVEIPEGFKYKDKCIIEHIITNKNRNNEDKFNAEKQYYINILKEWVKTL